jgi:hypothetical protein
MYCLSWSRRDPAFCERNSRQLEVETTDHAREIEVELGVSLALGKIPREDFFESGGDPALIRSRRIHQNTRGLRRACVSEYGSHP